MRKICQPVGWSYAGSAEYPARDCYAIDMTSPTTVPGALGHVRKPEGAEMNSSTDNQSIGWVGQRSIPTDDDRSRTSRMYKVQTNWKRYLRHPRGALAAYHVL